MSNTKEDKDVTSTRKWQYVPGRSITLMPIDLEKIRKELLEDSDSESDDDLKICEENDNKKDTFEVSNENFCDNKPHKVGTLPEITVEDTENNEAFNIFGKGDVSIAKEKENEVLNKSFCDGSTHDRLHEVCERELNFEKDNHIFRKSHDNYCSEKLVESDALQQSDFLTENTLLFNDISLTAKGEKNAYKEEAFHENKENLNMHPLNLSKKEIKKNDSFDLDFSALTIQSPIIRKKDNFNYMTPKINIIPAANQRDSTQFKTPDVKRGYCSKLVTYNNYHFRTPINQSLKYVMNSVQKQPNSVMKKTINPIMCMSDDGSNHIKVNDEEYIIINLLGKGGSSEVFCCYSSKEGTHVAIKLVSLTDSTTNGYINEVKLLESLKDCDRIIKMFDYEICDDKLLVVLEKGGEDLSTVFKQLAKMESHLPSHLLLFYWMEMLYAVEQIHSKGVIHSDLKPANFLRVEGGLKLIDFGIASQVQDDMTSVFKVQLEGSCNYISPEALSQQSTGNPASPNYGAPQYKIHYKSDVWSLGCILYQLVYKKSPFQHINEMWKKLVAITDPKHEIDYVPANWVSPKILDTIKRCLRHDVKSRPTVQELIAEYEQLLKNI